MPGTRPPAVAGLFYPGDPETLRRDVRRYLAEAVPHDVRPRALIAPHAGFMYSGPVAGTAYRTLQTLRGSIDRVVLLGPAHRVAFVGLAVSSADAFETPLGPVPIDRETVERLATLPQVRVLDDAHAEEHSLEVQLPFLLEALGEFRLVPIVVGDAEPEETAAVIDRFLDDPRTLVVVSSDLSHYHGDSAAKELDRATARSIESLSPVDEWDACGCRPINGLLRSARHRHLRVETLDLRNSSDTAGPKDRVVGYGAFALVEDEAS